VWRQPGDRSAHVEREVARGYALARATIEPGLKKSPDDWSLVLVRGALLHDEVDFRYESQTSLAHANRRRGAVREFERAEKLHAGRVGDLPEEEHSTRV